MRHRWARFTRLSRAGGGLVGGGHRQADATGVVDHSASTTTRALGWSNTLDLRLTVSFGDETQRRRAAARVAETHRAVISTSRHGVANTRSPRNRPTSSRPSNHAGTLAHHGVLFLRSSELRERLRSSSRPRVGRPALPSGQPPTIASTDRQRREPGGCESRSRSSSVRRSCSKSCPGRPDSWRLSANDAN